jgi:hypothetical protein
MDIKTAAWAWDRLEGRALGHKILLYRQMGVCYILDRIKNKRGESLCQRSVLWKPIHRELLIAIES